MKKYGVVRKIAREPHEIEGFYRVRMQLMQIRGVNKGVPVKVRAGFGSVVNRFEFETGTSSRLGISRTQLSSYNLQIGTKSKR